MNKSTTTHAMITGWCDIGQPWWTDAKMLAGTGPKWFPYVVLFAPHSCSKNQTLLASASLMAMLPSSLGCMVEVNVAILKRLTLGYQKFTSSYSLVNLTTTHSILHKHCSDIRLGVQEFNASLTCHIGTNIRRSVVKPCPSYLNLSGWMLLMPLEDYGLLYGSGGYTAMLLWISAVLHDSHFKSPLTHQHISTNKWQSVVNPCQSDLWNILDEC